VGVEIGGAVKNVIAIAAGMAEGLGLGTNAQAGLVTRGCLEMQTLARSLGASPNTLMGLSGVGDTFGTCFGPLSRNRNLGIRLGQGEEIKDILASSTEVAHILYSVAYILYSEKIKDILASSTEVACILYSVFTAGVSAPPARYSDLMLIYIFAKGFRIFSPAPEVYSSMSTNIYCFFSRSCSSGRRSCPAFIFTTHIYYSSSYIFTTHIQVVGVVLQVKKKLARNPESFLLVTVFLSRKKT
jgi:hypothetical protein